MFWFRILYCYVGMWWFRLSALRTFTGSHHFAICWAKEMFAVMLLCGSYKLFAQGRKLMWNFIKVYVLLVLNCLSPPWAFCWTGLWLFVYVYGIALRLTIQRWITRSGTGGRLLSISGPTVVPVTDYRFSSYRQHTEKKIFYFLLWVYSGNVTKIQARSPNFWWYTGWVKKLNL